MNSSSRVQPALRALVLLGLLAPFAACDRTPNDPPPLAHKLPAPNAPLPTRTQPGIQGDYRMTGTDWTLDHHAYTATYRYAFARLSVFSAPLTSCDALRITQPAGYGAPLSGYDKTFAIAEIELYRRQDSEVDRYRHDPAADLLATTGITRIRSDGNLHGLGPEHVVDDRVVARMGTDHWASEPSPGDHWIQFDLDASLEWNQLVVYWPVENRKAGWPLDPPGLEGLRSQRIVVQARHDGEWATVPLREIQPAGLHDGHFLQEALLLDQLPEARLAHLETFRLWPPSLSRNAALAPDHDEIEIDGTWSIELPSGSSDLVRLAAEELRHTLTTSMSCGEIAIRDLRNEDEIPPSHGRVVLITLNDAPESFLSRFTPDEKRRIADIEATPQAYAIDVGDREIWVLGADSLGSRYGACRIEERMRNRRAPFLRRGLEVRWPAFRPRISASMFFGAGGPDRLGFPDWYLSQMVHSYLDGIYIFQPGPYLDVVSIVGSDLDRSLRPDSTKIRQLRGLVRRAHRQGLGVYFCVTLPGTLPSDVYRRHPEIRGGSEHPYVICLSTPEGKALIEESVSHLLRDVPGLAGLVILRSEMSQSCGGTGACERCRAAPAGSVDPAQAIFGWALDAAHAIDPEVEIIAFDWRAGALNAPSERELPHAVSWWTRPDSLSESPENSLARIVPFDDFQELARTHHPRRRIWVEEQISHPFPLHAIPEVGVPHIFWHKISALRRLMSEQPEGSPPFGFGVGNGSGFGPYAMQDLVYRRLLWEPLGSLEDEIGDLATRWYGPEGAGDAVAAWSEFSDAILAYGVFDKYLPRFALMAPPWIYDGSLANLTTDDVKRLCAGWEQGLTTLRAALEKSDADHQMPAGANFTMADATFRALTSLRIAAEWSELAEGFNPLAPEERLAESKRAKLASLVRTERENTRKTVEIFTRESVFRTHPYYRNWFTLPVVVKKLRSLEAADDRMSGAR